MWHKSMFLSVVMATGVASASLASNELTCEGARVYRYYKSDAPATLRATFDSEAGVMSDLSLKFRTTDDDSDVFADNVRVDGNYRPRSPLFRDHNRYTFDSLFCVIHLIVPKSGVQSSSGFHAFLQQICEDGSGETNRLTCKLDVSR